MNKRTLWALVLPVFFAGCAAMSDTECRIGDWYGAGLKDGQAGKTSQLAAYAEACQKVGVTTNLTQYNQGREQGLLSYCTPQNGYRVGRDGAGYAGVCSPALQAAFLPQYELGRQQFMLARDIAALENRLDYLQRERARIRDRIAVSASEDERRNLLYQLDSIGYEEQQAQQEWQRLKAAQAMPVPAPAPLPVYR